MKLEMPTNIPISLSSEERENLMNVHTLFIALEKLVANDDKVILCTDCNDISEVTDIHASDLFIARRLLIKLATARQIELVDCDESMKGK